MSLSALRSRLAARRAELQSHRVIVLAGGASAEREVSLRSGTAVSVAIGQRGYRATLSDVPQRLDLALGSAEPSLPQLDRARSAALVDVADGSDAGQPPIVVSTLHGADGENGTWQGFLELVNVPYVSAGVRGSAVAMDKLLTKRLWAQLGVPTPQWWVERRGRSCRVQVPADVRELVAKPVAEGSSVGVRMVTNDDAGWELIGALNAQYSPLLLEQRIHGRELTLAVIGHADDPIVLPLIEIKPGKGFYDYETKYNAGASEYVCPAEVDPALATGIAAQALMLYSELDLAPMSRFDLIVDAAGQPWFLEVNTLPGFTETSLLPKAARAAGIEFGELLELLMLCALERWERKQGVEV